MTERKRGRPATGRERQNNVTIRVTDVEKQEIKNAQKKHNQNSVTDLLLFLIKKN